MLRLRRQWSAPAIAAVFALCFVCQSVSANDEEVLAQLLEQIQDVAPEFSGPQMDANGFGEPADLFSADGFYNQFAGNGDGVQNSPAAFMLYPNEGYPGDVVDGSDGPFFGNLLAEENAGAIAYNSENDTSPSRRQWNSNTGATGSRQACRTTCSCYQEAGPTGPPGVAGLPGPRGPDGREGPQGRVGPSGPKGTPGRRGVDGRPGFSGPKGNAGRPGTPGSVGPKGSVGPIGQRGEPGSPGPRGSPGPKGERGTDGRDGCDGQDGSPGRDGYPGRSGPQGAPGRRGPKGEPGEGISLPGPKGPQGPMGEAGARGRPGQNGYPGSRGPKGDRGERGFSGRQGAPGVPGLNGDFGERGFGMKGPRGPSGDKGQRGLAGLKGFAGSPGPRGRQGEKGDKGQDVGTQGIPGPRGRPGDMGPSGVKGRQGFSGNRGAAGRPGFPGPEGDRGMPGDKGEPGFCTPLAVGDRGDRGNAGRVGNRGDDGANGFAGPTGPQGFKGMKGRAGPIGDKGARGESGTPGRNGLKGRQGPDGTGREGPQGPKGRKGEPGEPGAQGYPGPQGPKGQSVRGPSGPRGDPGPQGRPGFQGPLGAAGAKGDTGRAGPAGPTGPPGPPGDAGLACSGLMTSYIYTRHSQTTEAPSCGANDHLRLWTGFSLLHTEDEGRAQVQDLGRSGSCLRQFEAMPFIFCGANEVCTWGARTATSYWLASDTRRQYINQFGLDDSRERPLSSDEEKLQQISRCSVCLSYGPLLAVHSQNSSVPECPSPAWDSLWTGYSFAMHTVGIMGGGQPLESPGSCLQDFRHHPYIECSADGRCAYYSEKMTYWMAAEDHMRRDQFNAAVVKNREEAQRSIARCRVCSLRTSNNIFG